ncbi:MAG: type II toxin-antitoxin system RelE/ParE family toxin [Desulfobacterales bacterium]|jgi:mRNA interferase RelE/StbE|nr:type II toxin-antitoxin system RelE/ParE family toxin [Desulfobacteraceae bacterium]MDD3993505.1 type II toxin-antitoxin system RelE/ParE family toxin [Desulfobacteraceae bacterium]MDY0313247.1 type II toxin-antitoxin system RelE/ParE family toxin [Desulfobacterales bacterium]
MADYKVLFKTSVEKDFGGIPRADVQRLLHRIKALEKNPRPPGCEKLTGQERYRLRQGTYRIVYSIQDDELTVWVVKVGHRKDVYR